MFVFCSIIIVFEGGGDFMRFIDLKLTIASLQCFC